MSVALEVGRNYWWDTGAFWTSLELTNIYKNGRVRLIERAKDGGGHWFEVKTSPAGLVGPTDAPCGTHLLNHPMLADTWSHA